MLRVGDAAPDFDLPDAGMEMVRLADLRGKSNVVLYFYPKENMPACTLRVDCQGVVQHIIRKINPKGHAREVLNLTKELN